MIIPPVYPSVNRRAHTIRPYTSARLFSPGRLLHAPTATPAYVGLVILPAMGERAGTSKFVISQDVPRTTDKKGIRHDDHTPAPRHPRTA